MGKRIYITFYLIKLLVRSLFLPIKNLLLPRLILSFPGNLRNIANTPSLPIYSTQWEKKKIKKKKKDKRNKKP